MNLTNEDRELLDRHFEQDLTDNEEAQFQKKIADDDEFRQAVRLRELIHERVQAHGAAQLKEQLKANLAAQRTDEEWGGGVEEEVDDTPVRSLFSTTPAIRWAIAASFAAIVAAAIVFINIQDNSSSDGPVASEDTTNTETPVTGGQVEAPTYAGTDDYTESYTIESESSELVEHAVLIIDEARTTASYRIDSDTLFVYFPQSIFAETLRVTDKGETTILIINGDQYQINFTVGAKEQPLSPLE